MLHQFLQIILEEKVEEEVEDFDYNQKVVNKPFSNMRNCITIQN